MRLIEKLNQFKHRGGRDRRLGKFFCEACSSEVVREMDRGYDLQTCGCRGRKAPAPTESGVELLRTKLCASYVSLCSCQRMDVVPPPILLNNLRDNLRETIAVLNTHQLTT